MYHAFLVLHSIFRWFVFISLIYAIFRYYIGWFGKKPFLKTDQSVRIWTLSIVLAELIIGLILYFISPMIKYFLENFKEAVKIKDLRFFGMEHSLMMLIAVALITIGSVISNRKSTDLKKYKTLAIWFSIALFILLVFIPWPFSSLTGRPFFRFF
jgi:hypothetical protein